MPAGQAWHCPLASFLLFWGQVEHVEPSAVGTLPVGHVPQLLEPAGAYSSLPQAVQDDELLELKVPLSQG